MGLPETPQVVAAGSAVTAGRTDAFDSPSGGRPAAGRPRRVRWIAAAVLGLAATVTFGAMLSRVAPSRFLRPWGGRGAHVASRLPSRVDLASGVAVIVKLDGVAWDGPHPSEGDLLAAGHFRFRSGRATLSMLSGVSLVVEGPADLDLVSSDRVLCHQGKLRAHVPEEATGFVISGPGSAVVDLGTEVGMNVDAGWPDPRQGLRRPRRGGVAQRGGLVSAEPVDGPAEQSLPDRPESRAHRCRTPDPEDFVTASALVPRPLVLDPGYRDAVLRAGPWSYWRFESLAGGQIPNAVPGRPSLGVNGPIHLSNPASGNRSAVFGAGQPGQYLTLDGAWGPPRHPGYAVELWFLPEIDQSRPAGQHVHGRSPGRSGEAVHGLPLQIPPRADVADPNAIAPPAGLGPVPAPLSAGLVPEFGQFIFR